MSYIGQAALKNSELKRFDVTSSTSATHVLSWTAPNEQSLWITINGVKQQDDAYSIAGVPTTITLTDALIATDKMEVIGVLDIGEITVVGDNTISTAKLGDTSVTTAKIQDGAITTAKIVANAVVTDSIAANAVTLTEMAGLARGKLIVGDASGDPSALTVGTANQILTSDGTDATWAAAPTELPTQTSNAGKNLVTDGTTASWNRESPNFIINGDFDVWQRGTTFNVSSTTNLYTADRWKFVGNNFTGSLIRQSFASNQTDVPDCPAYFVRWINNTTMGVGEKNQFLTPIELVPSGFKLANQQITFSCWLKSASGTIPDGNVKFIKESAVYPSVGAITTTWTKFTQTWTLWNSNQGYLWVGFEVPATYALLGGIDIAHCQLELGGVATTFKTQGPGIGDELQACQRYFEKSYNQGVALGANTNVGAYRPRHPTAGTNGSPIFFRVSKRTTPTIVFYSRNTGATGKITNMSGGASDISCATEGYAGEGNTVANYTSTGSETNCEGHWTADAEL